MTIWIRESGVCGALDQPYLCAINEYCTRPADLLEPRICVPEGIINYFVISIGVVQSLCLGIDINYLRYHSYLQMDRTFALLLVLLIVIVGFLLGFLTGLLLSKYSCTRGPSSTIPLMTVPASKPIIRNTSEVQFASLV